MNSLPKTVTRQRRGCDLNPGPTAPESRTLTTNHSATEPPLSNRKGANLFLKCTKIRLAAGPAVEAYALPAMRGLLLKGGTGGERRNGGVSPL